MAIVKIQNRRGGYSDFDPSKLLPGEFAVVQVDDPNTTSGTAVYIAITAGSVVRLATAEEIAAYNQQSQAVLVQVQQVASNTQTYAQTAQSKAAEASQSAFAAASAQTEIEQLMENAENTINGYAEIAKDEAIDDINEVYQDNLDAINSKIQQIIDYTSESDAIANQALAKANNLESEVAETGSAVDNLKQRVTNLQFDVDQRVAGGYVDVSGYLVLTDINGEQIGDRIGPFAGGGGGGGGSSVNAEMTATNTTGWISNTISEEADCEVKILWSSIENDMPTGNGVATIKVNNVIKATFEVPQGEITFDLKPYIGAGTNNVKITIADVYSQERTVAFNVSVIALRITSTFDVSSPFTGVISFPYTPVGDVSKTIYFILDGVQIGTQTTSVSNRQLTYTIPAQSHGGHTLRVYYETQINNQTVRSNELYYEFISVETLNDNTIIISSFNKTSVKQYETLSIPYYVYNPINLTAAVDIYVNNVKVTSLTVDRVEQTYTYRANTAGTLTIQFKSGETVKTLLINVSESSIDVEPETENLVLYLSAQGRSNQEANPLTWIYENIEAEMTGFNLTSDCWQLDEEGITCLRVSGNARVAIPFEMLATDIRQTGMTIEIEYATRNVADYNTTILSCMSDNRGITITPQRASLSSEQTELYMQYKEGEHIRVSYVIDKRTEDRLVKSFIEGKLTRVTQYPTDDDFQQANPVGISIGSNSCTMDIYCIRVYTNNLSEEQILNNWIADTQVGATMLDRYTRNQVYDAYGKIVISQLPSTLPYFILDAAELPQYKGDKKTISGSYTDPTYPSRSFTFTGCQINVQGTSSAPYYRKNFDMQFLQGFEMYSSGHADVYKLRNDSMPTARFVLKADVASSESANNVELVRLYNEICPYKTAEMLADSRVRWGIDGIPIVVFWHDTTTDTTKFWGKYNFNFPKRFPQGYGYAV